MLNLLIKIEFAPLGNQNVMKNTLAVIIPNLIKASSVRNQPGGGDTQ